MIARLVAAHPVLMVGVACWLFAMAVTLALWSFCKPRTSDDGYDPEEHFV